LLAADDAGREMTSERWFRKGWCWRRRVSGPRLLRWDLLVSLAGDIGSVVRQALVRAGTWLESRRSTALVVFECLHTMEPIREIIQAML